MYIGNPIGINWRPVRQTVPAPVKARLQDGETASVFSVERQ